MKLTLRNKMQYDVTDNSTKDSITFVLSTYSQLDDMVPYLTADNFRGAKLGEEVLEHTRPQSLSITDDLAGGNVVAVLSLTEVPLLDRVIAQLHETQEAVAELQLGGLE